MYGTGIKEKDMHTDIDVPFIILSFCKLCGVNLSQYAFGLLARCLSGHTEIPRDFHFSVVDVMEFTPKIHYPAVLDFHFSKYLLQQVL